MQIESEQDFPKLRTQLSEWRKRFPMFTHDVISIERIVEQHIKRHSQILIQYRQTHKKCYLEQAQKEIDTINQVIATVEKIELMAMLSRG
jgi:DNA-binding ferritin-like protein